MTIADSEALRARRARKHRAGDHSLCVRCAAVRKVPGRAAPVTDPVGELRGLAGRLAAANRADPGNALLARELRMTLQALAAHEAGGPSDAELEDLFAALQP